MDDLVRIYHAAITDERLSGPVNACAPHPVRFRDFMYQLREFKKAVIVPVPIWILKLFLQETADVVSFSQKMAPAKLSNIDFKFSYKDLHDALKQIFS